MDTRNDDDEPADGRARAGRATSARRARRPGRTFRSQGDADALMAEAAGDAALDPGAADRRNVVLLLQAAFFITGSMNLPRGWVRATTDALEARGCRAPDAGILRWYRSRLVDDPGCFAGVDGVAPEFVSDLMDRAHA